MTSTGFPSWLTNDLVDKIRDSALDYVNRTGGDLKGCVFVVWGSRGEPVRMMTAGGEVEVQADPWAQPGRAAMLWRCSTCQNLVTSCEPAKCNACLNPWAGSVDLLSVTQKQLDAVNAKIDQNLERRKRAGIREGLGGALFFGDLQLTEPLRINYTQPVLDGIATLGPTETPDSTEAFFRKQAAALLAELDRHTHVTGAPVYVPSDILKIKYEPVSFLPPARCTCGKREVCSICSGRVEAAALSDPLDVEYDHVKLRTLLAIDESRRTEVQFVYAYRPFTAAQRAAVSAHWSAELRAKVRASAAAEQRRVVVDLEDE